MQRDRGYLLDILESARLAVQYLENKTEQEFYDDTQTQDAVIRRFEVIGEAARRISDKGQSAYPGLPWMEMIGMRNIMIHEYDNIDLHIVWNTIKNSIPGLIDAIAAILGTTMPDEEK
jgi:uncharacterized protein with HEPN domain